MSSVGSGNCLFAVPLDRLPPLPTPEEGTLLAEYVARRPTPEQGYEGVLWILLNSGEFVLNR